MVDLLKSYDGFLKHSERYWWKKI